MIQLIQNRFTDDEVSKIAAAEALANRAHTSQKRESGEPYFVHPLAVAQSLADWGMDAETIIGGLLHDTVEDTDLTIAEIEAEFGAKVAELVSGVTKLGKVTTTPNYTPTEERKAESSENIRKLLLATIHDLRVVVIKLADRLHNLQTLKYCDEDKQRRIGSESLEIYAPLADRLGMGEVKAEIEDLSFKYTNPLAYRDIELLRRGYLKKAQRYLKKLKHFIVHELKHNGLDVISVESREKHLYSVFKKLAKTDGDINKIYDLMAVRIMVPEINDCYKALGILHQHFKPLIYRIKDYIAVPKPNGYRSLHTTVFALDGRIIEIQIRTPEMHLEAEKGLAAHFYYDANKTAKSYSRNQVKKLPTKLKWVAGLVDLQAETTTGSEFVEALKIDLFQDRIFVFSPKGDLYDLPERSTPIDFAFAIHSDIGLRTQGARVNNRLVPLDTPLGNRDVVEILTRKIASPNRDWLNIAKTPHARNRIKAWFRSNDRGQNMASGKSLVEQGLKAWGLKSVDEIDKEKLKAVIEELKYKDVNTLLAAVGEGTLTSGQVLRRLFPPSAAKPVAHPRVKRPAGTGRVVIANRKDLPYVAAPCCNPVFPLPIVGFVTRGKGVTLHLSVCHNLPTEKDRLIECHWEVSRGSEERLLAALEIVALNRVGLLRDLTGAISSLGVNISGLTSSSGEDSQTIIKLSVEVSDLFDLAALIKKLERFPGVLGVNRMAE